MVYNLLTLLLTKMTIPKLRLRPIWLAPSRLKRKSYWVKYQCNSACLGHIIPFDRLYEESWLQNQIVPIDYNQYELAHEQELSAYESLVHPSQTVVSQRKKNKYTFKQTSPNPVKIFGVWS